MTETLKDYGMQQFDRFVEVVLNHYKDGRTQNIYMALSECAPNFAAQEQSKIFVEYIIDQGLINKTSTPGLHRISAVGLQVTEEGGWKKYNERLRKEAEQEEAARIKQEEARVEIESKRFRTTTNINRGNVLVGLFGVLAAISTTLYTSVQQNRKIDSVMDSVSNVTKRLDSLVKAKPIQKPDSVNVTK